MLEDKLHEIKINKKHPNSLSLTITYSFDSTVEKEIQEIAGNLSSFYYDHNHSIDQIPEISFYKGEKSFDFRIYDESDKEKGKVNIKPWNTFKIKGKKSTGYHRDIPMADNNKYLQIFYINFITGNSKRNTLHRDEYAGFLDPSNKITKRK